MPPERGSFRIWRYGKGCAWSRTVHRHDYQFGGCPTDSVFLTDKRSPDGFGFHTGCVNGVNVGGRKVNRGSSS